MSGVGLSLSDDMSAVLEHCGEEVAQELMDRLPGVEIKVPLAYSKGNPLTRLEVETAECIIEKFAGEKLYVPTTAVRIDKVAAAREMRKEGKTSLEVALALEVSERYARTLLSRTGLPKPRRVHPDQIDLEDYLKAASK
ncbi:hypothetical protein [Flexibacterium corallicola]|uniref:hypothetical protein n=1 Tax=Flexibacterium corallicola TaxID=3037259 RepID=UPI00286F27E7|nr:hypothetical protein [Pseudovibrio sp. M1P-2-3]